jgi:monovalent cation/hydrogen antiporter
VHSYEIVLLLLAICVGLGLLARKLRLPEPTLLVMGGLVLSLQPWAPRVPPLAPDLVLLFFLPPLLYAAAFNTHWNSFRTNLRAISLLAVGLVLFTATIVAIVAHEWIGLPWAVGFVLGAIVSPPDAVAALAITRQVKVPEIVTTILEGESLVNDASALVATRTGVAVVVGGTFSLLDATTNFVLVSLGGIAIGCLGAVLVIRLHRWLNRTNLADAKLTIAITLLTPFAIYLPAEHLHVSGVLAVVTAGLWIGQRCESLFSEEVYLEARAVWEMVEFLLNGLIFILIGFQLPVILDSLDSKYTLGELAFYSIGVSFAVIVARFVWVFPGAYWPRWIDRNVFGKTAPPPPWQNVFVVAWTGMRGVVSLAAAMALPVSFPHRDLVQFLTFWVIFVTLVGQGLTLPWIIRRLGISQEADSASASEIPRC